MTGEKGERRCQVMTEDGDSCDNRAKYERVIGAPPRWACEECFAALVDEGKIDHDFFTEITP